MKPTKREEYINTYHKILDDSVVKIVEYETCKNIVIEFDYGFQIKTTMNAIKNRNYTHPNKESVYNKGFLGVGGFDSTKNLFLYDKWSGVLRRCYDNNFKIKRKTYSACTVDKEWHNFQNFAKWFYENYNPKTMEGWQLDKDILVKGNKHYSKETCAFVPQEINTLFIKRDNDRGNCAIGVSYNIRDKNYCITLPKGKLGIRNFKTEIEAFQAYKTIKENYIKEVADKWKGLISDEIYDAMYKYEVEITD